MNQHISDLPPWLAQIHHELIIPRRKRIQQHPFMLSMLNGSAEPKDAQGYFSGLMWHLLDFGKHVGHLMEKRDPAVADFLAGRSEDKDGDTAILGRIVEAFGGPAKRIEDSPWTYDPHPVWVWHDALLRAAIYSPDLPWQVGTAALNVGIESLVPYMIEPLFKASVTQYGVSSDQARWLESRSGEEERQHGENGYWVLSKFVDPKDRVLVEQCRFYIDALSRSMSHNLLQSGLERS
jgi:pyrroloquinoline quinone (PQQ) biosynthesis protein C